MELQHIIDSLTIQNTPQYKRQLQKTYDYAWKASPSDTTRIAAGIYQDNTLVAIKANELTPTARKTIQKQFDLTDKNQARQATNWILEHKYEVLGHAEKMSIAEARKHNTDMSASYMILPWYPCTDCAEAIVDSNISTLITHVPMIQATNPKWVDHLLRAKRILDTHQVQQIGVTEPVGAYSLQHGVLSKR